jgi:hypothetical protein
MIWIAYLFNERPEGQPSYMPLGKKSKFEDKSLSIFTNIQARRALIGRK